MSTSTSTEQVSSIVETQLESLDDTDCFASAWADAIQAANDASSKVVSWGGRGKGGRGLARRTFQPHDVSLENVRLEYVSDSGLPGKLLLEGARLKLLSRRVFALVGRNGCGKSTLLRRVNSGKIPGFPTHLSSMYIPQEVVPEGNKTPLEFVLGHHGAFLEQTKSTNQGRIEQLEKELEQLDLSSDEDTKKMEDLCEQISAIEDETSAFDLEVVREQAQEALAFFGIDDGHNVPMQRLSGGERKKVILACALFCRTDLCLLDEPTNFLDVQGLVQLRRLVSECIARGSTVVLVSHDVDLINDVATDVIYFHNQSLAYYPGNYRDFVGYKRQQDLYMLRENASLEKKRESMMQTIDNLKKQPVPKRGGAKKKSRTIESAKKKLEKQGLMRDEKGHRWTAQNAGSGIKQGSINSLDAAARGKMSHSEMLKSAKLSIAPVPDKAVQFVFRNTTSHWGEPLIMAMDVGHGYDVDETMSADMDQRADLARTGIVKKPGLLFDCVDLCIDEGSTTCILGANGNGKSTLLRLLSKREQPLEGKIHHAHNINIGYFDQHAVDDVINSPSDKACTALSLLTERFPNKTQQDIRGELTAFGLSPKQALTNIQFLSGGERCRLCLAALMLGNPHVLIMDEPTSHLDVESVEALVYGLKQWNGTLVMVSHDANFIRSLDGNCYVIMKEEGKIRRIPDGIDSYLKTFRL